jgi:tetratricopeptide (TPR) repeat protein
MSAEWRQRTLRTWARTALALGEKDSAFRELEQIVQREGGPELTMYLVDELLADQQWQRAISLVRPLAEAPAEADGELGDSAIGDRARFRLITALFEQALASKNLEDVPRQAIVLAPRIHDPELRSRSATMIGDAYSRLGRLEHAADAYRGILR